MAAVTKSRQQREALVACIWLLGVALGGTVMTAAESSGAEREEVLEYRWHLSGFKGLVARLFIPGTGSGTLTTRGDDSGHLVTELRISSPAARSGDFWLYGSEIDPRDRRTLRAWSSQRFRGKEKQKQSSLEGDDAVDLASSIFFLRQELPEDVTRTLIWSGGRFYEVEVEPTGRSLQVVDGKAVRTRSYSLQGVGEPRWHGRLDIVLAEDEHATPLEIVVARDGMRVRLELVESDA
jgi:hypothetical protein